jgi:nitrite reductase/ring-hydroxylating ferredoxin subunit
MANTIIEVNMATKPLKRNLLQRIFGISATKPPVDENCWTYSQGRLTVDINRLPELSQPWGAVRIESANLPARVLLMKDSEGNYRAFRNHCEHAGRRLDPVPGTQTVQCCSVGQSVFNYDGQILTGSAGKPLMIYPVQINNNKLIITLPGSNGKQHN